MDKKIIAIVNPAAGSGKTARIWPEKSAYLKKEFNKFEDIYTEKPGDAVKIARSAVTENYDCIIAVGGDGTVNEIVNGMLSASRRKRRTKLIVYPLGTGSDLSRTLNLQTDTVKFSSLIKRGKSKQIKVLKAEFLNKQLEKDKRYFINIADCGMGAEVARNLNQSQKTMAGSLSYLIKIFQTLFKYQNKEMRVEADNKLIYQGKLNSAIIANGNYFGGGIKIAPEADLLQNKINLVLLKNFSKPGIIFNLLRGYYGRHLSHPLVESHLVKKVKITTAEKVELELDGESTGYIDAEFMISQSKIPIIF
ncbi:diacylglycerol/lipid kinase family protein [Halanaerobium kushneri]|uniref:Lipid kinase, YegS/Rv2252/BmrU family n=1 Tax=Halanaerobium kushneri TaxID=56779 RepID=A0A1N7ALM3_9FIRM|nr:diacylglycerol kinase family protein [Halanaerobium kushneri]SIR39901.1 lipid kinase, YegS/Rv2252/BmrU family [Halanaerobium kushneri]